jgi:hypothetical protein
MTVFAVNDTSWRWFARHRRVVGRAAKRQGSLVSPHVGQMKPSGKWLANK